MNDLYDKIDASLSMLRLTPEASEYTLHRQIASAFATAGLAYEREASICPGCRVDFLIEGAVILEVKRGKPPLKRLTAQLERYARSQKAMRIYLLVERSARIPERIGGVDVKVVSLNSLWGIAI